MIIDGVEANTPIYWGLGASLLVYLAVSFATPRTADSILTTWTRRLNGEDTSVPTREQEPASA